MNILNSTKLIQHMMKSGNYYFRTQHFGNYGGGAGTASRLLMSIHFLK
jgi:hypothetical protein